MYAAAAGRSTLGIPRSVGREFVGADSLPARAAGVMFMDYSGRVLLLRRSGTGDHSGEWAFPGGGVEAGETPAQAARREVREETGHETSGNMVLIGRSRSPEGVDFSTFATAVAQPFEPELNGEHTEHRWASLADLPFPLHPGVSAVLSGIAKAGENMLAQDRAAIDTHPRLGGADQSMFAFDRGSVRRYGRDGYLHVETAHISKSTVNPYRGKEIPNWEALGLDPNKIYRLYRPVEELEKAASTFNGLPILDRHVPVTSDRIDQSLIIGATGNDAAVVDGYLDNSLSFWPQAAIDDIEAEVRKELSSAYRYQADMTPGRAPNGENYDGVMRDLVGNHVALVKQGRVGDDVVVGDSMENLLMTKTSKLSATAILTMGALATALAPIMAMDAKLDLGPVVSGLTRKNFKAEKPKVIERLKSALEGKLAQDADLDDVVQLLDRLEAKAPDAVDEMEANSALPVTLPPDDDDSALDASGPVDKIKAYLESCGVDRAVIDKIDEIAGAAAATDEKIDGDPDAPDKKPPGAKDGKMAKDADDKDKKDDEKVDKPAMDAAIDAAVKNERKRQGLIRAAENDVRPYVGSLTMAFDSADQVYHHALKSLGVEVPETVTGEALKVILKQCPVPGAKPARPQVAMDGKITSDFAARFPDAGRISIAG